MSIRTTFPEEACTLLFDVTRPTQSCAFPYTPRLLLGMEYGEREKARRLIR